MNTYVVIIVAFLLLAINAAIFIYMVVSARKKTGEPTDDEKNARDTGLQLLLQQINDLARTVDGKMSDVAKTMDAKLGESSKQMQDSVRHQAGESFKLIKDVTVGKTLLTVEHDMGVVFGLADKIAVVVYGEVIAYDTPEAVRADQRVQEAYLGSSVADQQVGGH